MSDYDIAKELELTASDQDVATLKETEAQGKLLNNLKVSVRFIVNENVSTGSAVSIASHHSQRIIFIIRQVLKHGLKERRNGSIVTLWNFIYGNVPRLQEQWRFWYEDLLAQKPNLPHEPLFSFWLTKALSEHLVHHHLGVILTRDMISTWYEDWALLQNEENTIIFMTLMTTLESISFDITAAEDDDQSQQKDELQIVRRVKSRKIVKRKTVKIADSSAEVAVPETPVEEPPPQPDESIAFRKLEEERKRLQQENKVAAEEAAAALAIAERLRKEAMQREADLAQQRAEVEAEQERKAEQLKLQEEALHQQAKVLEAEKQRIEQQRLGAEREEAAARAVLEAKAEEEAAKAAAEAATAATAAKRAEDEAREAAAAAAVAAKRAEDEARAAAAAAAAKRAEDEVREAAAAAAAKRAEDEVKEAEAAARRAEDEAREAAEKRRLSNVRQAEEEAARLAEKERTAWLAEEQRIARLEEEQRLTRLAEEEEFERTRLATIEKAQQEARIMAIANVQQEPFVAADVKQLPEVAPAQETGISAEAEPLHAVQGTILTQAPLEVTASTPIGSLSVQVKSNSDSVDDSDFLAVDELTSLVAEAEFNSETAGQSNADANAAPSLPEEPPSAQDILAEVRRAADAAAAAAQEFERKYSAVAKIVENSPPKQATSLQPTTLSVNHGEKDMPPNGAKSPTSELLNLDPEARRRAISEKLKLLRVLNGEEDVNSVDGNDGGSEQKDDVKPSPEAPLAGDNAAMQSPPPSVEENKLKSATVEQSGEQTERWRQLEEDLKRMRAEQEALQQEAFEAERQRRLLQAENEAKRLLEEARRKRVEQEEEELARRAAEEEAAREMEREKLLAELNLARGSPAPQTLTDREMEERLREELEAEKTRTRLQKELGMNIDSSYFDSPNRSRSSSSSHSPSPTSSRPASARSSTVSAGSPRISDRPQHPPSRNRAMSDFDANVGVLLDAQTDDQDPANDGDEFQPKHPHRKALSFRKPYSYEQTILSSNQSERSPNVTPVSPLPRTMAVSATPDVVPTFSQYKNPDGLSQSYMEGGRTPREADEPFGSFVDPTVRESMSSSNQQSSTISSQIQPQLQKRLEAAKKTEVQEQRAKALDSASAIQDSEASKSKQNFTLEDFLSGELDGLEEDTSTSAPQSQSSSTQEPEEPLGAWAPPKKRVYFNIQVKGTPESQGNLCTGCGKQFHSGLFGKNARYCDYSGKYFCPDCHSKQVSIIPARVVRAWDFKPYQVSNFYRAFLVQMFKEPLYDIDAISPTSYQLVPQLKQIKVVRIMLSYMRDYTASCRKREQLLSVADKLTQGRSHLYEGSAYSLNDLIEIQKGKLLEPLIQLCKIWMHHILYCEICRAKGSYCEFCRSNEVIYPFHLRYSVVCKECRAVSHRKCFKKGECPRCKRLQQRKETQ